MCASLLHKSASSLIAHNDNSSEYLQWVEVPVATTSTFNDAWQVWVPQAQFVFGIEMLLNLNCLRPY